MANTNAAGVQEQTYLGPDGSRFGQTAADKISFHDSTPVAQHSATVDVTGFVAGAGTADKDDSVYAGASGSTAYTVGDIVTALKANGLMKS